MESKTIERLSIDTGVSPTLLGRGLDKGCNNTRSNI